MNNETHCADCGAQFIPTGCGTGYATLSAEGDKRVCYTCADKRQVEDLKDRSKPFVGYLRGDKVTSWTGGELMRVVRSRPCRLTRRSNWHDSKSFRSVHCIDPHGGHWTGRGSDGVAIRLRPVKG